MRVVRGLWEDGVSNVDFPGLGVTSSDISIWVLFFIVLGACMSDLPFDKGG